MIITSLPHLMTMCLLAVNTRAFSPAGPSKTSTSQFFIDTPGGEPLLKEIADHSVEKESKKNDFFLNEDPKEMLVEAPANGSEQEEKSALASKLERLMKPRPYPLFVAEKVAELVEGMGKALPDFSSQTPPNNAGVKERIVILGTGWGSASFLKTIDTNLYDVSVISPRNFFVFTPMLAGASVGSVEVRSITETIRDINRKVKFMEATATHIDPKSRLVSCESVVCPGNSCDIDEFTIEYDRLIVAVGAQTNTFGIPGVKEHCNFLKQIDDARKIRAALVNCFERANLPNLTDKERQENLSFAVIGAGPAGIEFAAELRDFVEQECPKYYPHLLKYVQIRVIEASSTVLAPFDKALQEKAINILNEAPHIKDPEVMKLLPECFRLTQLLLDSSVKEVTEKAILLRDGSVIPYGIAVWAAGNGPLPITLQLIESLGNEQAEQQVSARGRVAIDPWLRAFGGHGRIIAFGDCSCMTTGALPATAQVAAQQGEYLGHMMNKKFDLSPPITSEGIFLPPVRDPNMTKTSLSDSIVSFATESSEYAKPFQFLNLGILAYTGDCTALAQMNVAPNTHPLEATGRIGNFLWRSVYLSKQMSLRNGFLVMNDWAKRKWFGRDITRF